MEPKADESIDRLMRGRIHVIQARKGYRVSEDAIYLTWFAHPEPCDVILDAGTGSGVIAFGLAMANPSATVVGLEIQQQLAERAARGVRLNSLADRVTIVRGDVRIADRFIRPGSFDLLVSNPPYYEHGRGLINPFHEKAVARHQMMMPPADLFRVARSVLRPEGRVALVFPFSGLSTIAKARESAGFMTRRVVWIHPRHGHEPVLFCEEAVRGRARAGVTEQSLWLYDDSGKRTQQAEAILAGEDGSRQAGDHALPDCLIPVSARESTER
jgi:tRNA1Val (adenine37-N6)-methyltransferase